MSSSSSAPRVFISYSHDSSVHVLRVLELADALRASGVDAWIDQYESVPALGWQQWMVDQIADADFVLVVCTETYRRRFEKKEVPGKGKGVSWEGAVISAEIYEAQTRQAKFLPVSFDADFEHVPIILRSTTYFAVGEEAGIEKLLHALAGQSPTPAPLLGAWRPLAPQTRRYFPHAAPVKDSAVIEEYKVWALERYSRLDLVGLGAKDFQLSFDDIYVPLRADPRFEMRFEELADGKSGRLGMPRETLEVDRLFLEKGVRHAILLGDPGSGKTTALKKLHRLALQHDPRQLGLEAGTVPVFLRLRRLGKELFGQSLQAFLAQELQELSNAALSSELAAELWRCPMLLLLDGLDEIGDARHRADVCRYLSAQLVAPRAARLRLLISCRQSGYSNALDLSFAPILFEAKPLEKPQIEKLVHAFYLEAGRLLGTHNAVEAKTAADELVEAIAREEQANARVRSMVSTPLLLTLLCVVVFRGNEIPRHRVTFYEQCLRILLGHWRKQAGRTPPVEVEEALVLLEELAWELHREEQREGLTPFVAADLWPRLEASRAFDVFDWLYRDAGILAFYAEHSWGFVHLGLQEYLAARWLAKRDAEVSALCGRYGESWWQEVLLQLAALDRRSFGLVVGGWLAAGVLLEEADLLRQALVEARDPDYGPFLAKLRQGQAAEQAVVLRLLRHRPFPELVAAAERLAAEAGGDVQALAEEICRSSRTGERARDFEVAFLHGPGEEQAVARLRAELAKKSVPSFEPRQGKSWRDFEEGKILVRSRCALILVVGESDLSTIVKDVAALGRQAKGASCFVLRLPASRELSVQPFASAQSLQLESLDRIEKLFEAICGARVAEIPTAKALSVVEEKESFVEKVSGETFLLVPGGEFVMGGNSFPAEQPPHRVKISPFLLARTPVTNRQYELFLKESRTTQEPQYWRDADCNAPDQPVVGVSWAEAMAYCRWLSSRSGREVTLPSEAQWEYAARGGNEQREYPWGAEDPTAERASYGQSDGKAAAVGSCPKGKARWGHLDLAGNVWEWCRDGWAKDYSWCKELEVDPCLPADDANPVRALRGGGFWSGGGNLRFAYRGGYGARFRDHGIGFRVAASPAST